jgi:putative membrane protein
MKSPFYLFVVLAAFAFSPVHAYAEEPTAATEQSTPDTKQKEQEVLGTLVVLNKNEIGAAKFIEKNKATPAVKKYAVLLDKDHSENLAKVIELSHKLGKPVINDDANKMKKEGEEQLAALKELKGKELDKTYIDDMVKGHEAALDLIDNTLLPNSTTPELKKFVEDTRKHIAHHLEEAKAIQAKLD